MIVMTTHFITMIDNTIYILSYLFFVYVAYTISSNFISTISYTIYILNKLFILYLIYKIYECIVKEYKKLYYDIFMNKNIIPELENKIQELENKIKELENISQ